VLLMHSRTAWGDYYTATNPTTFNSTLYTSRHPPSATSVYTSNCLFRSISSSGVHGGALYCTSATYFLVESTSFFSCKTSSAYGGAIFFSNSGGQCVLHEVCGYDCCITNANHYQFAYIYVKNDASSKNYVNYSSIVRCVNKNSDTHYTLGLIYGNICCPSVNFSMNKCYYRLIYCQPFSALNSVTCSFSYSSFTDNTATGHCCIWLWTQGANYEIKSCNILRNAQIAYPNSEGTILTRGNLKIDDSCILENTATYIFYTYSSYTTTLSNCTVDKTTNNAYLTTKNTVTKSFILGLNHMSTRNCVAEYDSAGYLTPVIQTPSPSKKQRQCYTGQKIIFQLTQENLFSLINLFVFNFIHPYASSYPFY
jgi:hypothetical protein